MNSKKLLHIGVTAVLVLSLLAMFTAGASAEDYTFVTKWGSYGTGDGMFDYPIGIAVDSSGYVYVADTGNDRIQKFDSDGTFITKWGSFGTGDGEFWGPEGIAVDSSGYVYVVDRNNHRIQKFDSVGTFITKWGSYGTGDGTFYCPQGIAVDSSGYVYVADSGNDRIQKFDSVGTFITKWGSYGRGDGEFAYPMGIAVDSSGYVYVADTNNYRIQKFDSVGTFITKWGSYGTGDGTFYCPQGIAVDSSGYVYVADTGNDRIQKFDSVGTFITKWGSSGSGDGMFDYPIGMAVDSSGYVYVTDRNNHRIQKFAPGISEDPSLSFTPSSHDFGDMHEGDTDSTTFEVWNSGTGTLTYSLSESCSWVEVNPTSGSSAGEHDTITVDVDTTGLSEGSHTCDITISSNGGSGTFTVTVNVVPCPESLWTFMVYLAGDNNLEGAGIDDFLEMSSVGSSSAVNIVVQFDRIPGYDGSYGDWTSCKRFYVTPGMTPTPANASSDLGECNMGDPNTLDEFVTWAMIEYPAENYALILWNHGSGWKKFAPWDEKTGRGVCWDVTNGGDYLTLQETELALTGKSVQLLGYDACFMHMIEVVYQVMDNAGISAGSEETEPWDGWPYNTILDDLTGTPTMTPSTLGATIVSRYIGYYPSETQSAVDNVDLLGLVTAVDNLAQALISELSGNYNEIKEARDNVQHFGNFDYIDLYHFAELIKLYVPGAGSAAQAVMDNVDTTVYAEAHGSWYPNAHGLSIYFPKTEVGYLTSYENTEFAIATEWDEFLKKYYEGPELTIAITTDKYEYHPGDTMTITVDIENPTASSVDTYFVLRLILPEYSYQKPMLVTRLTLPPYFDQTYNNDIYVGNWATIGFNAEWYVALLETSTPYDIICDDTAEWRYDPDPDPDLVSSRDKGTSKGGSVPPEEVVPEQIAEAIRKSIIGEIALPVELAQEEEITEEILDAILERRNDTVEWRFDWLPAP